MKAKIFVCTLSIIAIPAFSQNQVSPSGEIADREVVVVKDRINTLGFAEPILGKAETQPVNENLREFSYGINPINLELPSVKPTVSVQKLEVQKLSREYPNYIKAGAGNRSSSFLEGYFHNGRDKSHSLGGSIKHFASSPVTGNFSVNPFSENTINIYGKKFTDEFSLGGSAGFERNRVNLFVVPKTTGFAPGQNEKEGQKQIHQTFKAGAFLKNTSSELPFRFTGELDFYHYLNEWNATENDFSFNATTFYKFSSESSLSGNLYASSTSHENLKKQYRNLSFFAFEPAFRYKNEKADAVLGLKLHHEVVKTSNTGIYPNISLRYTIAEDVLYLFTYANGGKEKSTLASLVKKNPFMSSSFLYDDSLTGNPDQTFLVSGGFEGNVKTNLDFRFGYGFGNYDKNYFFYPSLIDSYHYIITEVKNISVQHFFGETVYHYNHALRIGLNVKTSRFDMNAPGDKPWHVPEAEMGLQVNYTIKSKIGIHSEISYLHNYIVPQKTKESDYEKERFLDLNLGLDYRFSSRFSVFATAYNLTNKNYTRYYNYPVNGLTVLGGASFSF